MRKDLRKVPALILAVCMILITAGCARKDTGGTTVADTSISITTATETSPATSAETSASPTASETAKPSETASDTSAPSESAVLTLADYFPILPDVSCRFDVSGGKDLPVSTYVEFIGQDTIQIKYDNGTTVKHVLYAIRNGEVRIAGERSELYAREDLSLLPSVGDGEILLKEPLKVGTTWYVGGGIRSITDLKAQVDTPTGMYSAIEVTTIGNDTATRQYYAPGIGLVKTVRTGAFEDTSVLGSRTTGQPETMDLTFYYPKMTDTDVVITSDEVSVKLYSNDSLTDVLTDYFRHPPETDVMPIMSENAVVNSVMQEPVSGVVTIDFSKEFISGMNAGAAAEGAILQSIANTAGSLYGASQVIITIDNQLYESGHIAFKQGETLSVDYYNVT